MSAEIRLPALTPTMTEGTLSRWFVGVGDQVRRGDVIAELEVDKVAMELEADRDGEVREIRVPAGTEGVGIHEVLLLLAPARERFTTMRDARAAEDDRPPAAGDGSLRERARGPRAEAVVLRGDGFVDSTNDGSFLADHAPTPDTNARDLRAVDNPPFEFELAEDIGGDEYILSADDDFDLTRPPLPPASRITPDDDHTARPIRTEDVRAFLGVDERREELASRPSGPRAATAAAPESPDDSPVRRGPESGWQSAGRGHEDVRAAAHETAAERVTASDRNVPHVYLEVECRLDRVVRACEELNESAPPDDPDRIGPGDLLLFACTRALSLHARLNASWRGGVVRHYDHINLAMAVATASGIVTPVLVIAETRSLGDLACTARNLTRRAHEGDLAPEECRGGTFSVLDLGDLGVDALTPVVNVPQAAILAIGAPRERPVSEDGAMVSKLTTRCTLGVDQRVVDGAEGARFLSAFRGFVENPITLLG